MKTITRLLSTLALAAAFTACGPERPAHINLEQAHNPLAQHILAPGFGTIGLIRDGALHVYFQDDQGHWIPDDGSRFDLPPKNRGVIAMGMATIGVVEGQEMNFYRISDNHRWEMVEGLSFEMPRRYDRLLSMNMNWEMALLGVETDGRVVFYSHDGRKWVEEEGVAFVKPEGIKGIYSLGDMTLVIRDEQKLGLYYHIPDTGWEFMEYEEYVLLLPEGADGLVPVETRVVALLKEGVLSFYQLDITNDRWNLLTGSDFQLPW